MPASDETKQPTEEVNYGSYLALSELLKLQRPRSTPEHPDELLFIVVHQASELWFKLILHELDGMIGCLQSFNALGALNATKRVNTLVRIVTAQLRSLDTLPPQNFAQFRGYLGTSSGSQSVQFRAIEAASGLRESHFISMLEEHGPVPEPIKQALLRPTLQELFDNMLAEQGVTLEAIYTNSISDQITGPLQMLAEALLEYEQEFSLWRFLHVQLVERIIGPNTGGTGGTLGSKYLRYTLNQRFFPRLWEVRSQFFKS